MGQLGSQDLGLGSVPTAGEPADSSGSGPVTSVTAGDASIIVGGTPTDPTVRANLANTVTNIGPNEGVVGVALTERRGDAIPGQKLVAQWTLGATRWYAIDGALGNDANAGFSDVSLAAAGAVAKRTFAGMAAIFPRYGAGRQVELVIAAGTYAESLGTILAGVEGYAISYPMVRGTSTNATAGAVAFANTQADKDYVGAVTATGCNAAGYNPTGVPTTTVIQCLKVGGGAAAIPAEPAAPLGWRLRFDSATTTAALRNISRTVIQVAGTDTLTVTGNAVLPAVPVASDTFYLEQAGVVSSVTNQWGWGVANQGPEELPPSLVGIRWSGSFLPSGGAYNFVFCGANGFFPQPGSQVELGFAYFDPAFSTFGLPSGGGMRIATGFLLRSSLRLVLPAVVVAAGGFTTEDDNYLALYDGSVIVGGVSLKNNRAGSSFGGVTIGGGAPLNKTVRISSPIGGISAGLFLQDWRGKLGFLAITSCGAKPAIKLTNYCILFMSSSQSGSTGNTDVGLDLTSSRGSLIVLASQPTVTGTAGDIRLAGSQIVTWAQAFATGITDSQGNRIVSAGAAPLSVVAKFSGVSGDAAVPTTSYFADDPNGGQAQPLRYPTSMRLVTRLRLAAPVGTGANPPTATLYKNGVATAMTCTLGAGAAAGANVSDTAHPILFLDGDSFDVQVSQPIAVEGAAPFVATLEGPA